MNKTEIVYLDDKGNEVSEDKATKINIIEYDEKGDRIKETFMVKSVKNPEAAKKFWDSVKVDPNSDIIKNSFVVDETPNPIQDFLDSQKTK